MNSNVCGICALKGSPDDVEFPLDDDGELLLFDVSGVRDHVVGKSQAIDRESLGPSIVLKHSSEKGLWKEESWEPVSCRKPFKEITVFIRRMFGFWAR